MPKARPVAERLFEKIEKGASGGCWMFTGCKDSCGYGKIGLGPGLGWDRAHRVMFRIMFGAIPDGMIVTHLCDNPSCVNPGHLRVGTHAINSSHKMLRHRFPKNTRNLPIGIYRNGKSFVVRGSVDGSWKYIGSRRTLKEAVDLHRSVIVRIHEERSGLAFHASPP